jgi:CrcB protein
VDTLTKYMAVAFGGAIGAMLRYYITLSGLSRTAQPFPTATFVINITGSFIIGFFLTLVTERIPINPHLRLAVAVGFVGAYTTFSTFEYETARLVEGKDFLYGFLYVVLSFAVGFGAVWAGIILAREVVRVPVTSHMTDHQMLQRESERRTQSPGSQLPDSNVEAINAKEPRKSDTHRQGDDIR